MNNANNYITIEIIPPNRAGKDSYLLVSNQRGKTETGCS